MNDREEIRWKFEVIQDNLRSVNVQLDNQRKFIDQRQIRAIQDIEKMRNLYFAFIGFFMTISISVIIARGMEDINYLYPIIAGVIGFLIFFFTNLKIEKSHKLFKEIGDTYFVMLNGLFSPLEGMVSTYALIEDLTKEDTLNLLNYVTLFSQGTNYSFTKYLDEKLEWEQFKHEDFRNHYDLAKISLDSLKEKNYPLGTQAIEDFISNFEKNDKKSKK